MVNALTNMKKHRAVQHLSIFAMLVNKIVHVHSALKDINRYNF